MYIYHALINALSAHMIHINLNMIFYIVSPYDDFFFFYKLEDVHLVEFMYLVFTRMPGESYRR